MPAPPVGALAWGLRVMLPASQTPRHWSENPQGWGLDSRAGGQQPGSCSLTRPGHLVLLACAGGGRTVLPCAPASGLLREAHGLMAKMSMVMWGGSKALCPL